MTPIQAMLAYGLGALVVGFTFGVVSAAFYRIFNAPFSE